MHPDSQAYYNAINYFALVIGVLLIEYLAHCTTGKEFLGTVSSKLILNMDSWYSTLRASTFPLVRCTGKGFPGCGQHYGQGISNWYRIVNMRSYAKGTRVRDSRPQHSTARARGFTSIAHRGARVKYSPTRMQ
jgi:hypothetical protein